MNGFRSAFDLPLFRRELTEMAQRKRTYVTRVAGALLLTVVMLSLLQVMREWQAAGGMAGQAAGAGTWAFFQLVYCLFWMIPVIVPALCSPAIATEKEQNTFGSLLLTQLSPSAIVLEKLLSRLVPMLTLLLLVSPQLAYLYSLGGLPAGVIVVSLWLLFCDCLLYASVGLFCSAWFTSTVSAFVGAYAASAVVFLTGVGWDKSPFGIWLRILEYGQLPDVLMTPGGMTAAELLQPVVLLDFMFELGLTCLGLLWMAKLPLLTSLVLLVATRVVLVRRAFVQPSQLVRRLFQALDRFFTDLNSWTTGGIELTSEHVAEPGDRPVAWREQSKKTLGQVAWLVRVLVVLELPALSVCAIAIALTVYPTPSIMWGLSSVMWVVVGMVAVARGVSLFGEERSRQTLEALLSTPLTTQELLEQKISGTNRLVLVLACPLVTAHLCQSYLYLSGTSILYVPMSTLLVLVTLRSMIWVSMVAGMMIRSNTRAIIVSLLLVIGVNAVGLVPSIACNLLGPTLDPLRSQMWAATTPGLYLLPLSPLGSFASMEGMLLEKTPFEFFRIDTMQEESRVWPVPVATLGVGLQLLYLVGIRRLVMTFGSGLLQRRDTGIVSESAPVVAPAHA